MTKKKTAKKKGEQLDLIDVAPENMKKILAAVVIYKDYQKQRLSFLKKEIAQKAIVQGLVKKGELKRLEDGTIRFSCAGYIVEIEPRDDIIKIKKEKPAKTTKGTKAQVLATEVTEITEKRNSQ